MPIVGGLDIHRKQITFDYPGTVTGQVRRGQVSPAGREHLRGWLARFAGCGDAAFAVEGCTGWRHVAEELAAAGVTVHLAEPAGTAFARGRKRHAKTDLLTELQVISAAQETERPQRRITMLSGMPESAAARHRDRCMTATESGHTVLNRSPASPRCCFSGTSHDASVSLSRSA
jgi:hypothetical protein